MLLLDTHVLLWWLADSSRLGPLARSSIQTQASVLVSVVTGAEIAIKRSLGKLDVPDHLADELVEQGFEILPLTWAHTDTLAKLPMHHRDPFDRMLLAQATTEDLRIVTADRAFTDYDVRILDAAQ